MRLYRPHHFYVLFDFDTLFSIFGDLFDSVFDFFMIFVPFFHSSWTDAAALPILGFFPFFGRSPPTSVTSLEGYGSRVFSFILRHPSHSLEIS